LATFNPSQQRKSLEIRGSRGMLLGGWTALIDLRPVQITLTDRGSDFDGRKTRAAADIRFQTC
jgi:hypothetical protein